MNRNQWKSHYRRLRIQWSKDQLASGIPEIVLSARRAYQQSVDILEDRSSLRSNFRNRCSCYWETVDFTSWEKFVSPSV